MRRHFTQFARKLVTAMDFGDVDSIWTSEVVNLTRRSAMVMEAKLQALRLEIRELAESERDAPGEEKLWYSMMLLAYCHNAQSPGDPLGWAFSKEIRAGQTGLSEVGLGSVTLVQ